MTFSTRVGRYDFCLYPTDTTDIVRVKDHFRKYLFDNKRDVDIACLCYKTYDNNIFISCTYSNLYANAVDDLVRYNNTRVTRSRIFYDNDCWHMNFIEVSILEIGNLPHEIQTAILMNLDILS